MGDRRVADRREPEKGVLKIKFKSFITYSILVIIILISVIGNIVLGILYSNMKKNYDVMVEERKIYKDFLYENDGSSLSDDEEIIEEDEEELMGITKDEMLEESEAESGSNEEKICDLTLMGDTNQISKGKTETFELKATNIASDKGIIMFETLLDYDENNIECTIETDNTAEWEKSGLVEKYLTMSRKDLQPSTEDQTIALIKIKVKDNAQSKQEVVQLKNITFTGDEDNSYSIEDKKLVINIK